MYHRKRLKRQKIIANIVANDRYKVEMWVD